MNGNAALRGLRFYMLPDHTDWPRLAVLEAVGTESMAQPL